MTSREIKQALKAARADPKFRARLKERMVADQQILKRLAP